MRYHAVKRLLNMLEIEIVIDKSCNEANSFQKQRILFLFTDCKQVRLSHGNTVGLNSLIRSLKTDSILWPTV